MCGNYPYRASIDSYIFHTYIQFILLISIPLPFLLSSPVFSTYLPSRPNFLSFYCDNPLSPISAASMWMCGHPPGQWATYQWPLPTPEKKRDSPYPHTISYPHPCFPARGGTSGDPFSFMIKFLTILILLSTTRSDKYSTVSSCNIHARPKAGLSPSPPALWLSHSFHPHVCSTLWALGGVV